MTLSNFDWTDKTSVKWFIMLPTGHEGPYSLEALARKKSSLEVRIWAEGLSGPVTLRSAIERSNQIHEPIVEDDDEMPPPLPPLPDEDEDEDETSLAEEIAESPQKEKKYPKYLGAIIGVLFLLGFGLKQWVSTQEHFNIRRANRMSPDLFEKINQDFKFEGWSKKIFFKEYVPSDMSQIWLATSSFQNCHVEAHFNSLKGKLLAVNDDKITFKSSAQLENHLVEFSNFEFSSGNKIVPGLYEMDLKATDCKWGSLAAKLGNFFQSPQVEYVTRMKIVLYHKGNVEFNTILDKLIRRKIDFEVKNQNQEELFWQDLQQKLQTLLAISLQIEQLLLEFTELPPTNYKANLKKTVDKYTQTFGSTLTEFVIQNEKYFLELERSELSNMSKKRTYEGIIRVTSKNIGFESMKIIEELQSWKKPARPDLNKMEANIKKKFEGLKGSLNQNLLKVSEDRVN